MSARRIVDLSHPIDAEIPMFPGLPTPEITELLSREASAAHYAGDTTFVIHRYGLTGNSGTYLDTPFHRYAGGADLARLPLERLVALPGIMIDVSARIDSGDRVVPADAFADLPMAGCAVLIRSGWDRRWGQPGYLDLNPHLTAAAGQLLAERGVALVGIDSWNIDDTRDGRRPVHSTLLGAGIPIIENLRGLDRLPPAGFRFSAPPIPIRGGSAIPVRAYALIES